jgi:uncharacterized glycosyltransferase HI_0868
MKSSQKQNTPLISVIIPIYNASTFLDQTIDSVLKQDYPNLEILLINDGSTDYSAEICHTIITKHQLSKNLKASDTPQNFASSPLRQLHFFDLPHQGVSATRNFGLTKISGEYFCFLDADDLLTPTFISELHTFAHNYQLKYVTSTFKRVLYSQKNSNLQNSLSLSKNVDSPQASSPTSQRSNKGTSRTILPVSDYLRKLFDLDAGYNFCHMKLLHHSLKSTLFDPDLVVAEDALYNFTLVAQLDHIGIIQKPLYLYQVHQSSTVRTFTTQYVKNYQLALQKISNFIHFQYPNLFPNLEKPLQTFIATHLFFILVNFCCHQQNPRPYKSISSLYKVPLFYRAIHLASLRFFSPQKAFIIFCFKLRLIPILKIIGFLRNKQNTQGYISIVKNRKFK